MSIFFFSIAAVHNLATRYNSVLHNFHKRLNFQTFSSIEAQDYSDFSVV